MTATDSQPVPSIETTFGALYVGSILSTVLYGFITNQAFVYYMTYGNKDGISMQLLVFGLWILDSFQVVLVIHMTWFYLVEGFGDPTMLSQLVWSFCLELGVTVLVTFIVRALYLKQLWRLSDKKLWLVVPAFVLAAGQLALGLQTMSDMLRHPTIATVTTETFRWMLGSKCVASVLADVIITSSLCYFLHVSRTGFRKTNDLVNTLLVYTINRGVLAMLMETAVMITFFTMKDNFIFAALHLMLGKLHTGSLFALLIRRDALRTQQVFDSTPTVSHVVAPSNLDISYPARRASLNLPSEFAETKETFSSQVHKIEDQYDRDLLQQARKNEHPDNPMPIAW